ncbi:hypothetical protein WJX84_000833 [Apatococcus fuscideae]|uniref:Uncharacterized protein n=1 Tax=Apatococcus fuscideae TaxID=2026836 RepID=A0AAW1TGQ7_9CHLO
MGAADAIKGFAQARESAFFKMEQEVDLQRHHSRLVNAGRLEQMAGANLRPRRMRTFEESVVAFEVLPEVLQQQARLDDPTAAARREFIKKIRGMPSRLSDAEMLQYRSTVYGVASTVGHIPRMHMGRLRWTAGMEASAEAARAGQSSMLQLPPEALEVGQRISSAGTRSVIYGTMLAVVGMGLATTLIARSQGIRNEDDLRERMQSWWAPVGDHAQQHIVPWRLWLQERVGRAPSSAAAASASSIPDQSPSSSAALIHPEQSSATASHSQVDAPAAVLSSTAIGSLELWPQLSGQKSPEQSDPKLV